MAGFACPMRMVRGVPVITAPPVIDGGNASLLRSALAHPASLGYATIVLDLSGTAFCDPAGLDVLVRVHRGDVAEGGELRLVVPDGPVRAVLAGPGLARLLPQFSSVAAAVAELPAVAIEPVWGLAARQAG
jgi:anti-anti-sigma factor